MPTYYDFILQFIYNNRHFEENKVFKSKDTCFGRINSETLIPESTDENIAIIRCDHKTMCIDLYTLVNKVCDLPFVHTRVIG